MVVNTECSLTGTCQKNVLEFDPISQLVNYAIVTWLSLTYVQR